MTKRSRIEKGLYWDRAWSLIEGCTPVSPGCKNCWSAAQAYMRKHQKADWAKERYADLTDDNGKWTGEIKLLCDNLELPLHVQKPTTWAVWNDLFHKDVPFEFINEVCCIIASCCEAWGHHKFLLLTKRVKRMAEWFNDKCYKHSFSSHLKTKTIGWPLPNIWLGATTENQEMFDERWKYLAPIPAAVHFISYEPGLGPLVLPPDFLALGKRAWCIIGCESGPKRRPFNVQWARDLVEQCREAGVPVFVKQLQIDGKVVKMPELDGMVWDQVPEV